MRLVFLSSQIRSPVKTIAISADQTPLACVLCTDPGHRDEEDDPQTVDDDLEEGEAGAQEVVADDGRHDDAVLSSRIPQHRWYTSIA